MRHPRSGVGPSRHACRGPGAVPAAASITAPSCIAHSARCTVRAVRSLLAIVPALLLCDAWMPVAVRALRGYGRPTSSGGMTLSRPKTPRLSPVSIVQAISRSFRRFSARQGTSARSQILRSTSRLSSKGTPLGPSQTTVSRSSTTAMPTCTRACTPSTWVRARVGSQSTPDFRICGAWRMAPGQLRISTPLWFRHNKEPRHLCYSG